VTQGAGGLYDAVRYPSYPHVETQPDRLATLATLHGLDPAPPATARVLDLGCGEGANLIGLAYAAPGLTGVGVDSSAVAIAAGAELAGALGLANADLRTGDLSELANGGLGEFDYVIAHGVYAWVPPAVREALLAAIAAHLAPAGVAFVSYNAQPGGHLRSMLREMGLFHARAAAPGEQRAAAAQGFYALLAELRAGPGDPYGALLAHELPRLLRMSPAVLAHDDLADAMAPVLFADFAARAAAHGLAVMCEADVAELRPGRLPAGVEPRLRELAAGNAVAYEQYVDFVLARRFHRSLLVRAEAAPRFDPARIGLLGAASAEQAPDHPDPAVVALVGALARRFPEAVPVAALDPAAVWAAVDADLVALHVDAPAYAVAAGERPRASALARVQAQRGKDVTSLRQENVRMEERGARLLLGLLDGTRDRAAIAAALSASGGPALVPADLDASLAGLAALGLLHE
jgi:SAM-dependent methyltransferase